MSSNQNHFERCPVAIRAAAYRAFIRRSNSIDDMNTDQFETDPVCDCADRRLQIRHEQFAMATGRSIRRYGY